MALNVAFLNAPTIGEIYPTLAIVDELVKRGHRVTYASVPGRRELLESFGANVIEYQTTFPDDADHLERPDRLEFLAYAQEAFLTEAESTLEQLEQSYADQVPDVIVYGAQTLAGRIIAAQKKVPAIQLWTFLGSTEAWSPGRHLGIYDPSAPAQQEFARKFVSFIGRHVPMSIEEFRAEVPKRHLMLYPRAFQYRNETFGDNFTFVGPCVGRRPAHEPWKPKGSGPVVLISLGTVYNKTPDFYRSCLESFAGTHDRTPGGSRERAPAWQVVLVVGHRLDLAELGPIPPNISVLRSVSQLDVLEHAKVFVTHAGMGGIMEALRAGVPMVTVPQQPEQEVNAERVVTLGYGVRLESDIRSTVERVAKDLVIARRVSEMRNEINACGGATMAAELIEASARV